MSCICTLSFSPNAAAGNYSATLGEQIAPIIGLEGVLFFRFVYDVIKPANCTNSSSEVVQADFRQRKPTLHYPNLYVDADIFNVLGIALPDNGDLDVELLQFSNYVTKSGFFSSSASLSEPHPIFPDRVVDTRRSRGR